MGVNGLLPILKSIVKNRHISEYKGHTIAIDGYCWLHRGAFGCAQDLCEGRETTKYVDYCMGMVEMLLHFDVKPLLVFDGAELPLKLSEENNRDRSRRENLERALSHKKEGNTTAALKCYQRAVDVTPLMAKKFIDALNKANIEFVVAPYEADAQMAYFAINNYVQAVITEDSDLLAYGCPKVLYKFNRCGECQEICIADLPKNTDVVFKGFTQDMFLEMCIMAGCDFLKALPRIGIRKAHSHISNLTSFPKVIRKLRMSGAAVPDDYHLKFQRVIWLFRHQRVFCPKEQKLVHLRPLPSGGIGAADVDVPAAIPEPGDTLDFLGPVHSDEIAIQVSKGLFCPKTKKPFDEKQDADENVSCEVIQCVRPRSKSIRVNGLRPLKKTTVTNLHHFFPTDKETNIDDKESTKDASKTTETRLSSSKTSLQSTESSVLDTTRTSGLTDDLSKESVKDSCKEDEIEDAPQVKKRQRRQSPMRTEIITGLSYKENLPPVETGDKDSSKILEDNKSSTETTISKTSESSEENDEDKQQEEEIQQETQSKTKSSVILEAGKQGNKRFHSISHITYFARAAKAALGKVHKTIVDKEEADEEVQEQQTKDHVEDFNKFAFKHLKKRAFHRM